MIRIDKYKNIDRGANPDKQYYIEQDGTRLSLTKSELEKMACDLNLLGIAHGGRSEQLICKCCGVNPQIEKYIICSDCVDDFVN